ncbi:SMI1/KNR4 family protein [Nonomuraea longicatena]|uniref:Knr4/Smi1-like domain-containing protein n=1 Tax=Nonomuraea longicatena TaxID=83682 RepID=A0ABN1PT02_9ACTN
MGKLLRRALTVAIVIAIGVRVRRRAQTPESPPPQEPPPPAASVRRSVAPAWLLIAGAVAVVAATVLIRTPAQDAADAGLRRHLGAQNTPGPQPVPSPGDLTNPVTDEWVPPTGPPAPIGRAVQRPSQEPTAPSSDPGCRPTVRKPVVRPLDPEIKRAVDRQWRLIERTLKAQDPHAYRSLGPRGSAGRIAVAEAQMGLRFPDALRASLLRHDGTSGFDLGRGAAKLYSIREIRDAWRSSCARDPGWQADRIPYLDGRLGHVDPRTGAVFDGGDQVAGSFLSLLHAAAREAA